ncbi:MAG: site-specific integrase [bacterium]
MKLTERLILRSPAPEPGQRREYPDTVVEGLVAVHRGPGLRPGETATDRRRRASWTFQWRRYSKGQRFKKTLGRASDVFDLDAARRAARKWNAWLDAARIEEETSRRKTMPTLEAYYKEFRGRQLVGHVAPGTLEGYDWLATLFGDIRGVKLSSLKPSHVETLHSEIGATVSKKGGPMHRTANRVVALVDRLWRLAQADGLVLGRSPAANVRRFPERPRDRVLSAGEIKCLFDAINGEADAVVRDAFHLLIFTGARKSNVLSMRWSEIHDLHGDAPTWKIPRPKAKGQRKAIEIPLPPQVVAILRRRPRDGEFVLQGRKDVKRAWQRITAGAYLPNVRIHDLRRTLASWAYNRGNRSTLISDLLGHSNTESVSSYIWTDAQQVRQAFADTVNAIERAGYEGA